MTAALDDGSTVMSEEGFASAYSAFDSVYTNATARGAHISQLISPAALCMPLLGEKSSSPCVMIPYLLYECADLPACTFFGNGTGVNAGSGGGDVFAKATQLCIRGISNDNSPWTNMTKIPGGAASTLPTCVALAVLSGGSDAE